MSIIHVSHASTLASAILAKAGNTTVSTKTLKKIEEVAARLYGVNNSGNLRPIASPPGKAVFLRDIKRCMNEVEAMPKGPARTDLQKLLTRIETRTINAYDRLAKSFTPSDLKDLREGTTNYENNFRLNYLHGIQGRATPK